MNCSLYSTCSFSFETAFDWSVLLKHFSVSVLYKRNVNHLRTNFKLLRLSLTFLSLNDFKMPTDTMQDDFTKICRFNEYKKNSPTTLSTEFLACWPLFYVGWSHMNKVTPERFWNPEVICKLQLNFDVSIKKLISLNLTCCPPVSNPSTSSWTARRAGPSRCGAQCKTWARGLSEQWLYDVIVFSQPCYDRGRAQICNTTLTIILSTFADVRKEIR